MVVPTKVNLYGVSIGSVPSLAIVSEPRDPTGLDVNYQLYQQWVNTLTLKPWILLSFSSSSGIVTANWAELIPQTGLLTLSDDVNTKITPDGTGNIQISGDAGLIETVASSHQLLINLNGSVVQTITDGSNSTTATGNVFTIVGNPFQGLFTTVGTNAIVIDVQDANNTGGKGVTTLATNANTITGAQTTTATTPAGVNAKLGPLTNHTVLLGAGSTSAVNTVSGVGTSGQVLTSNGAGADPTWQSVSLSSFNVLNVQVFTSNASYTPTVGMKYCKIEVVGGGGGGGAASNGFTWAAGTGGGAGGYAFKIFTAAQIGASQVVTIGSGGGQQLAGGTTSVGSLISATGGGGGNPNQLNGGPASGSYVAGAAGGDGVGGTINITGGSGQYSLLPPKSDLVFFSGAGGNSVYGQGGVPVIAFLNSSPSTLTGGGNGNNGTGYGSGGSGSATVTGGPGVNAGSGASGIVIITEYINQ